MTDMITWLRAQLDEDEQESHELLRMWEHTDGAVATDKRKAVALLEWRLADIAAKRAILDNAAGDGDIRDLEYGEVKGLLIAVRYLAHAYRDRPGYVPEWAPEGAGQ